MAQPDQNRARIAYLATVVPARSETFVYREILQLRARGWDVTVAGLYRPKDHLGADLDQLVTDQVVVNGWAQPFRLLLEFCAHPLRVLSTVARALFDAVAPGEPTSLGARFKLLGQAVAGITLAFELRRRKVEHLHCHFAHAPTSVGMYAALQYGIPFSFTGHANDIFQRRCLLKRKLGRAAFVVCISEWHKRLYGEIEPTRIGDYHIVRCGVDTRSWTPPPRGDGRVDDVRILSVARLVEKKGIDTLLSALARMEHNATLAIAGEGPERRRLKHLAEKLNCADRVTWLGAIDNEEVRMLMASSDVFVLPCRTDSKGDRDGIPVVLVEAMACGLAAVSGDLPAIRELIDDGESGSLVGAGDDEALAQVLDRLCEGGRARLGAAARAKVEIEFDIRRSIDKLESLFSRRE